MDGMNNNIHGTPNLLSGSIKCGEFPEQLRNH